MRVFKRALLYFVYLVTAVSLVIGGLHFLSIIYGDFVAVVAGVGAFVFIGCFGVATVMIESEDKDLKADYEEDKYNFYRDNK